MLDTSVYGFLLAFFIVILLLTNIVLVRYVHLFRFKVTASLLIYPFTFLFTDLISELYGSKRAEEVVISGLMANIWMGLVLYLLVHVSHSPEIDRSFYLFFSFTPGVIIGSMVAYLLSQLLDIHLFDALKKATSGEHLWLRNNIGTILSQLVDTLAFGLIAWGVWPMLGTIGSSEWLRVVLNEYFFKVIMALCDTPFLYLALYLMRSFRKKGE